MANRLRSLRPPAPPAEAKPESPSKALRVLGSVLAPTTVLTGLLFFFGRQHANWLLDYFGVPLSTTGLTAQDYLVRSADGLFAPIAVVLAAVLTLLWLYRFLRARLGDAAWERLLRLATPVAVGCGLAGFAVAAVGVVRPEAFASSYSVPGAGLSLGVLFLAPARGPGPAAAAGLGGDRRVAGGVRAGQRGSLLGRGRLLRFGRRRPGHPDRGGAGRAAGDRPLQRQELEPHRAGCARNRLPQP
jgi:hypothetical protein